MKKYIFLLFLLFPFFVSASFDQSLSYGVSSQKVIELQEFLTDRGYYSGPITGNFYSLTLKGVKSFQSANGLPTTGYFGPLSRQKANEMLSLDIEDSNQEAIAEGAPAPEPVKTNNDVVKSIQDQVSLLLQQIALLQQQLTTQQNLEGQIAQQNQVIQQQNSAIQQIQQNTQQIAQNTTPLQPTTESPKSQESLRIVTVNPRRGFDYQYKVTDEISPIDNDSQNEIYFGIVYTNESGVNNIKYDVVIEATDSSQSKTIKGTGRDEETGSFTKVNIDGVMKKVNFYPYVYKFNVPGQHTITFTVHGLTESVTVTAVE